MEHQISFNDLPEAVSRLTAKIDNLERLITAQSKEQPEPDKPYNINQAAEYLNLSIATIYSKNSKGELPSMKRNNRLYFYKHDLKAYIEAGKKPTKKELQESAQLPKKKGGTK